MFTKSALIAFLGAVTIITTASAQTYKIAQFSDAGSPHSDLAKISFVINEVNGDLGNGPLLTNVTCTSTQAINGGIATAALGANCTDPTVSFGLQYEDNYPDGYFLTVSHYGAAHANIDVGITYLSNVVLTNTDSINPVGDYQYLGQGFPTWGADKVWDEFDIGYTTQYTI